VSGRSEALAKVPARLLETTPSECALGFFSPRLWIYLLAVAMACAWAEACPVQAGMTITLVLERPASAGNLALLSRVYPFPIDLDIGSGCSGSQLRDAVGDEPPPDPCGFPSDLLLQACLFEAHPSASRDAGASSSGPSQTPTGEQTGLHVGVPISPDIKGSPLHRRASIPYPTPPPSSLFHPPR
jgi:hypothetical protein